jgi:septum formation protein
MSVSSLLAYPFVLASASPRRQELLKRLIPEFTVDAADLDEDALTVDDPWQTAANLAREKAFTVFERHPNCAVIGGDTVVALERDGGWVQLSKPVDVADAQRILGELSGWTHNVITGICVRWPLGMELFTETTKVTFKKLSAEQIDAFIETGEPMDKAGAYGLQGMARDFVEKIEGEVENVVGLPLVKLREALQQKGKK